MSAPSTHWNEVVEALVSATRSAMIFMEEFAGAGNKHAPAALKKMREALKAAEALSRPSPSAKQEDEWRGMERAAAAMCPYCASGMHGGVGWHYDTNKDVHISCSAWRIRNLIASERAKVNAAELVQDRMGESQGAPGNSLASNASSGDLPAPAAPVNADAVPRRDGHSALRASGGKIERFDPHPESAPINAGAEPATEAECPRCGHEDGGHYSVCESLAPAATVPVPRNLLIDFVRYGRIAPVRGVCYELSHEDCIREMEGILAAPSTDAQAEVQTVRPAEASRSPASSVPLTEEEIEYKVAAALQSGVVPPTLLRTLRDLALAGLRARDASADGRCASVDSRNQET